MKGDVYKETIHDGSVSYSVIRVAPPPGKGKHAKTPEQVRRRAWRNALMRMYENAGASAHTAYEIASMVVCPNLIKK